MARPPGVRERGGRRPGGGRGSKALDQTLFAVAKKTITPEKWGRICRLAAKLAGDPQIALKHPITWGKALDFALKAAHEDQIKVKHEIDALPPRPLDFKDPESRAMLKELALRVYADRLRPKAIDVEGRVVDSPKNGTNGNGHGINGHA